MILKSLLLAHDVQLRDRGKREPKKRVKVLIKYVYLCIYIDIRVEELDSSES